MNLNDARSLARRLMKLHKLSPKWTFKFDHSKVRFGKCSYGRKEISLSRHLVALNDEREVRETILHEIAHALLPPGTGHGPAWRSLSISIGCNGHRCYGNEVRRPAPKHQGTCPACRRVIYRHRRTKLACGKCAPTFDARFLFIWS